MSEMTWLLPAWLIAAPAIAFVMLSGIGGSTSAMSSMGRSGLQRQGESTYP